MVIQSITICSKVGKPLVARQYCNLTKLQLEEQIKSFPKSIQENQQHTFIELNSHRYIYLPLEGLYLILITTKMSNIIDDLETIRILQRLVIEKCKSGLSEKEILENAFELLLIFDDVVSFGYRESVTQQQVNEYLLMSSNQENLDKMLKMAKENEAKEIAKKFIREKAKEQKNTPQQHFESQIQSVVQKIDVPKPVETINKTSKFSKKSGLALGQKKTIVPSLVEKKSTHQKMEIIEETSQPQQFNPLSSTINIDIVEHLNCQLSKDGGLNNFEIIGEVVINCNDQKKLKLAIELSKMQQKLELKLHPNLNKQQWNDKNIIQATKESLPFNKNLSTLKYKFCSQDSSQVPFLFNYWFNDNSITLELEHKPSPLFPLLSNLSLLIPTSVSTSVESSENSQYKIQENHIEWQIPELSNKVQSSNLVLNFVQDISLEDCFPVQVAWAQEKTISGIRVVKVINLEDNQEVIFQEKIGLQAKQFYIV